MARVLVTDGEQRAALAVVRSLGHAGHDVFVCSGVAASASGGSRRCRAEARTRSPLSDPAAFETDIRRLIDRWKIDVLIPITDPSLKVLLAVRETLAAIIPFGSLDSYEALSDKRRILDAAEAFGIAIPPQRLVAERSELLTAAAELRFPLVLKPTVSIRQADGTLHKLGVSYARDAAALVASQRNLNAAAFPLLLQERIVGPGTGVFLLLWNGELLATFGHRRLREKPPSGGETVYTESTAVDPQLLDSCVGLVRHFQWQGALMIEFKVDERTGVPYLMEVNARFWAGLQLAIDAGVDFPALLVEAALGSRPAPNVGYRVGTRLRWFWGDVDNLITRLVRSGKRLDLPMGDTGSRKQAIAGFIKTTLRVERDAVFRRDDPGPFLRETGRWLLRK